MIEVENLFLSLQNNDTVEPQFKEIVNARDLLR